MAAFDKKAAIIFRFLIMSKKLKKKINLHIVIQIIFFIALLAADRITKLAAVKYLKGHDAIPVIKDVIELRYLENSGAAFGIFQNMQWMFYIITAIVLVVIAVLFISLNKKLHTYSDLAETDPDSFHIKTYSGIIYFNYLIAALAAGAIGNLIDRVTTKYVVDFIYFKIIDFPIFNFADICVTLTAVLLIIFFIFGYKEDKNLTIFGSKKSETENDGE